jgi:acetolactate synthase-1/2/3 large subunit
MRGADVIARALVGAGVKTIFSLSGHQIIPIYDACLSAGIEIVHTRHEAAAVFMADAYGQLTGGIGVALVSAGPGTVNAIGPLFSASRLESPVILLAGDTPLATDDKGGFQELDQIALTRSLTKLSNRVTKARALAGDLAFAVRTALSGRPGPVHLTVPVDIIEGKIARNKIDKTKNFPEPARARKADVTAVRHALAAAKRPLVVCGPSMNATRTTGMPLKLEQALGVPVIVLESPRGLNDPSLGNLRRVLASADLIVSLGKTIDFGVGFGELSAPKAAWIVVEPDLVERKRAKRNLGARLKATIANPPRQFAKALLAGAEENTTSTTRWQKEVAGLLAARNYPQSGYERQGRMTPAQVCQVVQKRLADAAESILISDGGEFGQWAQAVITKTGSRLINGPSANIGGSTCYAIAARKARPHARIYSLVGDGGIGFHLAEFETAVRVRAPFVAVVGNNESWYAEQQLQVKEYGQDRVIGCELTAARYDQAVTALGGHGEYVTELDELEPALIRAEQSGKPACVNVAIVGLEAPGGFG